MGHQNPIQSIAELIGSDFLIFPIIMDTRQVLQALPARLQWLVFFRLSAIQRFASAEIIRQMFFLNPQENIAHYSHVILTSEGRCLAPHEGHRLRPANDAPDVWPNTSIHDEHEPSVFDMYGATLERLCSEEADCIGIGREATTDDTCATPAFLHVKLGPEAGEATALLRQAPSQRHYEFLPVVGVDYLGGTWTADGYLARFRNRLRTHIHAGQLSGFARTEHCNWFFIAHGEINPLLAQGLHSAFHDRWLAGRQHLKTLLLPLSRQAMRTSLAMRCVPPPPEPAFAYGDVVPLGFLLRGLQHLCQAQPSPVLLKRVHEENCIQQLTRFVKQAQSENGLWAFHRGRLVTATDSALVLLGIAAQAPCEALEVFADGQGAYLPQLSAPEGGYDKMEEHAGNAHWRQADFATTCLIRGLRAERGLSCVTPSSVIRNGFKRRSGLFFANPYLVDWCVALALQGDEALVDLQQDLLAEVIASANPDGSYGQFDMGLSTALAVVCMHTLGYRGRALRLAQIRLLNLLKFWDSATAAGETTAMATQWPVSTPFYSTWMLSKDDLTSSGSSPSAQHIDCQGTRHALSLYEDVHQMVLGGVVAMALAIDVDVARDADEGFITAATHSPHPRYRCTDVVNYIATVGLMPYLDSLDSLGQTATFSTC